MDKEVLAILVLIFLKLNIDRHTLDEYRACTERVILDHRGSALLHNADAVWTFGWHSKNKSQDENKLYELSDMKTQQVGVDFWAMAKSMLTYGALTALCWVMLRLFSAVFTLPRRMRQQQQTIQQSLQELQRRFPDLNITEEDLINAEKELDDLVKEHDDKTEKDNKETDEKAIEQKEKPTEETQTDNIEDKKTK